jgi:hypothetical protein
MILAEGGTPHASAGFGNFLALATKKNRGKMSLLIGTCILTAYCSVIIFALVRSANPVGRAGALLNATGCLGCVLLAMPRPLVQPASAAAWIGGLCCLAGPLGFIATLLSFIYMPRSEAWLAAALGVAYIVLFLYLTGRD